MDLTIERRWLPRLFDLTPKVIVAAGDALADELRDNPADPLFEVWVFTPDTGAIRPTDDTEELSGPRVAVPNTPAATCVLAARTDAGCAALEPLRTWWAANGPAPEPICRCRDAADVLRLLLRAARKELQSLTAEVASSASQIYELRCESEQRQVVADSLRNELSRLRRWPRLMRMNLAPDGRSYVPPGGRGTVVQPLPVSAEGFAGIDLHFPPGGRVADDAQIMVRVHALDAGRDLGAWRLRAQHFGKGWVRCRLPEVLAVAAHNLELRVEWLRSAGPAPAISLAGFGDWDELRAVPCGSSEVIDGCLAVTARAGGVPGASTADGPLWCSTNPGGSVEYSLSADEVGGMRLHVPSVAGRPANWHPFQAREDGSFMLHPIGPLATTLQLTNGVGPDVERVTAVVQITSPQARGDVMYSLALSHSDEAASLLDLPDPASDPRFLAFSGWHTVPPDDQPHRLTLEITKRFDAPAHLILATRTPPGVDHAWAWADWLDVRFRVPGTRAVVAEPADLTEEKRAA
jgi:hypothetical protein